MIEKPPVRLERFAALRAEIDAGSARAAVIGRENISSETWESALAFWQKRMAEEAQSKRSDTTRRYQTLYRTKKRIFEKKLALGAKEEAPPPPLNEVDARPPSPADPSRAAAAPPFVAPSLVSPSPPAPPFVPPPAMAPPPVAPPSVVAPPPPFLLPPLQEEPEEQETRTLAVDVQQLLAKAKATPFAPVPPAPPSETKAPESTSAALPFKPSAPAETGAGTRFNLNQFASLTAEIAETPAQVAQIRQRYRITEAEHREESQRWTQAFAENAELRERYFGIVLRYREYLKKPSG